MALTGSAYGYAGDSPVNGVDATGLAEDVEQFFDGGDGGSLEFDDAEPSAGTPSSDGDSTSDNAPAPEADDMGHSGTTAPCTNAENSETIHSTLRSGAGDRDIESKEVITNAENVYYDENGNQVYRMSESDGRSIIVVRNPANGRILTTQYSSDRWVEAQISSGRWYDLQGDY